MNSIRDNKVNNIAELDLLHYILNTSKRTKYINAHYSPILRGCMNTRRGKSKFIYFLYIGCSYTILIRSMIKT